jgi:hypothetical protein
MKKLDDAAHEWVFETNGHKWSNNDNTAGDNFSSFIAGAKWQQEKELDRLKEAYSMGRMGKSIKEFNKTFNQQEQ